MKKIFCLLGLCLLVLSGCGSSGESIEFTTKVIENAPQQDEVSNVYYYNYLSDLEKQYYDLLLDASEKHSNSFSANMSFDPDSFDNALRAFSYDYPIYYWWRLGLNTGYTSDSFSSSCDVSKKEIEENLNSIETKKDEILAKCKVDNNYETIKNIHDYIENNFTYDIENYNGHSLLGGIIDQACVCDGYASTFKYLCNEAGFNCIIAEGQAIQTNEVEQHAWNLVELNNKWYNVDTTWDNDVNEDGRFISYKYFLTSDKILDKDHFRDGLCDYPSCDDDSLFYVNLPGKYFEKYDKNEVSNYISSWVKAGFNRFEIEFSSLDDCNAACADLLDGGGFIKAFEKVADSDYDITYSGQLYSHNYLLRIYYEAK